MENQGSYTPGRGCFNKELSDGPTLPGVLSGSYRFCVDYRDVNAVTKKNAYPIQNIDMILDKLRKAKCLSTIYLKLAHFQVMLNLECRQYTAFSVPGPGV